MRYYDKLVNNLNNWGALSDSEAQRMYNRDEEAPLRDPLHIRKDIGKAYRAIRDGLRHSQRILFDSKQAAVFDVMPQDSWPENWTEKLKLPFDTMYIEFIDPVLLTEKEPGYLKEIAMGVLFGYSPAKEKYQCTFFLQDENGGKDVFVDRGWFINQNWQPVSRAGLSRGGPDPSILPTGIADGAYIVSGSLENYPDRYLGWWERMSISSTALLKWIMLYMMAKSITVVEEPVSRQQRRAMERKGIPNPWHVVQVEPKFQKGGGRSEEDSGITHGYRYDVIGHLRFGKYPKKDGTYTETVQWIPPHQRGLANELYIPKVSKFEGGKVAHGRMLEYLGEPER